MSKLAPPGVSVLPITVQYPKERGPVHSYSVVALHTDGRTCSISHGGPYTILLGYSHFQAYLDLIVQETLNTLVYWEQKEHRIIVDSLTEQQRLAAMAEKAKH